MEAMEALKMQLEESIRLLNTNTAGLTLAMCTPVLSTMVREPGWVGSGNSPALPPRFWGEASWQGVD